jgi:3-hydroxybutyryl-CoA dehydrogenase
VGKVRTVAVIGAGSAGRAVAEAAALGGYRTILEDLLPGALRVAEREIRSHLRQAVERGEVAAEAAAGRLEFAHSVEEAARPAELVIEAVPDELESKIEIFTLLDKICRPLTILASNTSTLSISEIASVTYRAPQCVGMRFFPAQRKRLEIVRGRETSEETVRRVMEVARRMANDTVVVGEGESGVRSQ